MLDEYFAGNKRKILMETFAKPTITLALEIISRKHKLIQPQQMVSGETDQQRQNRLIAQGIIVLERLLDENVDELSQRLVDYFTQQSTVSALMKMSTNVSPLSDEGKARHMIVKITVCEFFIFSYNKILIREGVFVVIMSFNYFINNR